jgi:hypothetical protein
MVNPQPLVVSSLAFSASGFGTLVLAQGTTSSLHSDSIRRFEVPGSDTVVRTGRDATGHHASVSRDAGQSWQRLPDIQTDLDLRFARFDPLIQGEPTIPNGLMAPAANRLFIVQFQTEVIDEFKHDLEALGAERHAVLPNQAYLVRMDRATSKQVAAKPYVRWVGDFHIAYNLPTGFAHGFTYFSTTTSGILGNGNWLGVELDGLVVSSFLVPIPPFRFGHAAGTYPHVPYTFPVGLATALSGITFDAVAIFYDGAGNVMAVSNADRRRVQ